MLQHVKNRYLLSIGKEGIMVSISKADFEFLLMRRSEVSPQNVTVETHNEATNVWVYHALAV